MSNSIIRSTESGVALKASAVLIAIAMVTVSAACIYSSDSIDAGEADIQSAIDEKMAAIAEEYNSIMLEEYGITYEVYCTAMDYLADKAIYICAEGGELSIQIIDSIDRGKTFTDSYMHGDCMRIYIDTVSMSILSSVGITGFTAALGAMLGSVTLPGIGTLSGAAVGAILGVAIGGALSGLYTFMTEQLALDNGIWLDLRVRGHFDIFGNTIYYNLPAVLWFLDGYGAQ